jgi:hypothetical protein
MLKKTELPDDGDELKCNEMRESLMLFDFQIHSDSISFECL